MIIIMNPVSPILIHTKVYRACGLCKSDLLDVFLSYRIENTIATSSLCLEKLPRDRQTNSIDIFTRLGARSLKLINPGRQLIFQIRD